MKKLKIFIIAGEVSGDVLGAKIMRAIPGVNFIGVGGENMHDAGLKTLFPISDLAVMGFMEVLANARTLTSRINQTVDAIIRERPDIVLTIDSPGFAKRVVKKVKKLLDFRFESLDNDSGTLNSKLSNLKSPLFYHIVAPQVWAWGPSRARKYAAIFDRLYAFFDFEKPFFEKYGLKTIAVGHPIADGLKVVGANHIRPVRNIALIPGSRMSEVKKLLPIYKQIITCLPAYLSTCLPVVETTRAYIENEIKNWPVRPTLVPASKRYELFAKTDIAIAASGTVTAELAIMHVPTIVVYKMNPITEFLARRVVNIKWVSLVNILLNKTVYPELLGADATCENIICELEKLSDSVARKKMISELAAADKLWHKSKPAAELIAKTINK